MTQVIYGVPVGMVDKGRDVDRLISEWHRVFTLGGLIATLPWLVVPIINNRYLKPFLMPYKWHGHGTGHIIRVGGILGLSKASFAILSMLTTISVARENVQSSSKEPSFISPRQYVR